MLVWLCLREVWKQGVVDGGQVGAERPVDRDWSDCRKVYLPGVRMDRALVGDISAGDVVDAGEVPIIIA